MREPTLPHSGAGDRPMVLGPQARLERWLFALYHTPAPEGAVLCLGAVVYLLNPIRYAFPVGYAGLFSLMVETILDHGFALPWSVPYYGPGGIPFAYPPVGLYLAALAVGPLKIPLFTYLRFAPAILGLLALAAAFARVRLKPSMSVSSGLASGPPPS